MVNSGITVAKNKGIENLTPWPKGESGNPNGRPPKLSTVLKRQGYSPSQIKDVFATIPDCTKAELEELVKNEKATALEVSIARAFLKAMAKGEYRLIKDILEMVAGKPNQTVQATVRTESDLRTEEEVLADIKRLEEVNDIKK